MRHAADAYFTPDGLAEACLLATVRMFCDGGRKCPGLMLEPCAGAGAFGRAARRLWGPEVRGCDIENHNTGYPLDLCDFNEWSPERQLYTLIATNPPYRGIRQTLADFRAFQRKQAMPILAGGNPPILGLLLRETMTAALVASTDRPHVIFTTDQRPKWGGPGGVQHKSGDTCGAIFAVWPTLEALAVDQPVKAYALPDWRPRGRQ